MKKEFYEFTDEEKEVLVKGLRELTFYDIKGNQHYIETIEKLEKELGGY
jgi:hypothetical protein